MVWSSQAEITYDKIIENILEKWNDSIAKSFIYDVDDLLIKLTSYTNLCPKSEIKNLRKCLISKQVSLVYKVQNKQIYLVTFIFNESDHGY